MGAGQEELRGGGGGGEVEQVERGLVAGLVFLDLGLDEDEVLAIGRELDVADPVEGEEVGLGDGALLGVGGESKSQGGQEQKAEAAHVGFLQEAMKRRWLRLLRSQVNAVRVLFCEW